MLWTKNNLIYGALKCAQKGGSAYSEMLSNLKIVSKVDNDEDASYSLLWEETKSLEWYLIKVYMRSLKTSQNFPENIEGLLNLFAFKMFSLHFIRKTQSATNPVSQHPLSYLYQIVGCFVFLHQKSIAAAGFHNVHHCEILIQKLI